MNRITHHGDAWLGIGGGGHLTRTTVALRSRWRPGLDEWHAPGRVTRVWCIIEDTISNERDTATATTLSCRRVGLCAMAVVVRVV